MTRHAIAFMLICSAIINSTLADKPHPGYIPYIASDENTVRDMLSIANAGPKDIVYDLGSGDGRIPIAAVRDFNASRAVGIEIDPNLVDQSRQNAEKAGLTDRVKFIQGDLFETDFSQADVVTLYLGHQANISLRPKILSTLKPGTRIVSHQFNMGEWIPDKELSIRKIYLGGMYGTCFDFLGDNPSVPDYFLNEGSAVTGDKIFLWTVPAPVAGIWRGRIKTENGIKDYKMTLHQHMSTVDAVLDVSGHPTLYKSRGAKLTGNKIKVGFGFDQRSTGFKFEGNVQGESMEGVLSMSLFNKGLIEDQIWKAKRDKSDFTGTWQWPCATGARESFGSIHRQGKGNTSHRFLRFWRGILLYPDDRPPGELNCIKRKYRLADRLGTR